MLKQAFAGLVAVVVLSGCGKSAPRIASPADGQAFSIRETPNIDVTMADNDYKDVRIEFKGTERVPDFAWAPSQNGPSRSFKVGFGQSVGGQGQCTQQSPCTVIIIATRGDQRDLRTIQLYY